MALQHSPAADLSVNKLLARALQAERVKQEEEQDELAECVFRPEISKLARNLKAAEGDGTSAAWQRLYQRGQITAKRQVGHKAGSGRRRASRLWWLVHSRHTHTSCVTPGKAAPVRGVLAVQAERKISALTFAWVFFVG
jgi:hypothetical protein